MAFVGKRWKRKGYYIFFQDRTGQRRSQKSTFPKDKDLAQREAEAMEKREGKIRVGIPVDTDLSELLARYLADAKMRTRPSTWTRYDAIIDRFKTWLSANAPNIKAASQVRPDVLHDYRAGRAAGGAGGRTANADTGCIKTALAWACTAGLLESNPLANLKPLPHTPKRRPALTADEAARLVDAAPEPFKSMWTLALHAGLRNGELRRLTWRMIDLKGRRLTIPAALSKSKRDDSLPLDDAAMDALRRQPIHGPDAPCFLNPRTGKMYRPETLSIEIRKHVKAAKIQTEGVDVHALRHTAASLWCQGGASPAALQALMRHSTALLTLNVYTHVHGDDLARAADRNPMNKPAEKAEASSTGSSTNPPEAKTAIS
jgi:integrase